MYCSIAKVPHCFEEGNGNMTTYSESSAFWLFNLVTNMAYSRYSDMIQDIRKQQNKLELGFIDEVAQVDRRLKSESDPAKRIEIMTQFSTAKAEQTMMTWKKLSQYLLVKYIDGNVKKEKDGKFEESPYRKGQCVFPEQPKYPEKWYKMIVDDNGKVLEVPKSK